MESYDTKIKTEKGKLKTDNNHCQRSNKISFCCFSTRQYGGKRLKQNGNQSMTGDGFSFNICVISRDIFINSSQESSTDLT